MFGMSSIYCSQNMLRSSFQFLSSRWIFTRETFGCFAIPGSTSASSIDVTAVFVEEEIEFDLFNELLLPEEYSVIIAAGTMDRALYAVQLISENLVVFSGII